MGRARILQCMIENARVEEEVVEGTDPGSHARRAMEYIQEAVGFAKHTQNQRLPPTLTYGWVSRRATHFSTTPTPLAKPTTSPSLRVKARSLTTCGKIFRR